MRKLRNIRLAFAVSLIMSLSLFTSSVLAAQDPGPPQDKNIVIATPNPSIAANVTSAMTSTKADVSGKTDRFKAGTKMHMLMTFAGHPGYAKLKIYKDGKLVKSTSPYHLGTKATNVDQSFQTDKSTGKYIAQIYWCTKSDCSDAALAHSMSFSTY